MSAGDMLVMWLTLCAVVSTLTVALFVLRAVGAILVSVLHDLVRKGW